MYERTDTSFQTNIDLINLNKTLGEVGFNFYVGVSDLNGQSALFDGYLNMTIARISREYQSADVFTFQNDELSYHKCTEADAREALSGDNEVTTAAYQSYIRSTLYCLDDVGDVQLANDEQRSAKAQYMIVNLTRCEGDGCKSKEEIDEFVEKYSYLLVVFN